MRVLDVLAHEKIHDAVGHEFGHKGPFRKVAKEIGLEGKMTATVAGQKFIDMASPIITMLGEYPHDELVAPDRKKQTTRMLKFECDTCGLVYRTSNKWRDKVLFSPCPDYDCPGSMT